jgi:hypothetical protein
MADSFGDLDNEVGPGKRPAPTIEGTATEVKVEPAADGETGAEFGATGPEPESPEAEPRREGPPPRTSPSELKSFVTHLAAGLLGGLIGVLALAFAWNKLPARNIATPDLSAVEHRLAKLEVTPAPAGDAAALGALDARLKTLEEQKPEVAPDLSGLIDRVSRLETTLDALSNTAKEGGSVADAAALDAKIGDLEQRLQGKIDAALTAQAAANGGDLQSLKAEVAALTAKLGALAEAKRAADGSEAPPDLTTLDQRISALEAALPALSVAIDRDATSARSGVAAIAFANLRDAVRAGRPYAPELAALRDLMESGSDLGVLPLHADTGIPTVPELARALQQGSAASRAPAPAPAEGVSFLDSVIASARSSVTIRRIDAAPNDDSAAARLGAAEIHLKQGDLAATVAEVEALPAPTRETFANWLGDAHARLSADETLTRLESAVLAAMGETTGTAKP